MTEISPATKKLIEQYGIWHQSLKGSSDVATIHVDEVALRVAAFYENIRTIVDWKEEHLMRRSAIIRKLTKRFSDLDLEHFSVDAFAESLVLDLIRGGYFPNDKIPETKIADVQKIVNKYVFIIKNNPESKKNKKALEYYEQLLEIAACEIEETLAPSIKEIALIDYMFELMRERIKVNENVYQKGLLKKEEKDTLIYIAIQQALFKLDEPIIGYNLIKYKYPQWENPSEEDLLKLSQNINNVLHGVEVDQMHPLIKKFYSICEKYDTAYLIIGDVLSYENYEKVTKEIQEPSLLEGYIRKSYDKRLNDLKDKISRAAIYSTLSIFVTKMLSLLILEYIIAWALKISVNYLYLGVDVIIPTALMATLVIMIKPPSNKNLNLVIMEVMKIFYVKEKMDSYTVKAPRKRGLLGRAFFLFFYLIGAFLSIGAISWGFYHFNFPLYSIIINIVFIMLILFAGSLIQKRAQELTIEENPGGFLSFLVDILFLPLTASGYWMSSKWKKYNFITALLNALIDMPFSMFVEFLERWRGFIKEKKEEMR